MQHFLTYTVQVLQIAVWFSIFCIGLGSRGVDTAKAQQETGVNTSWQMTGGPMSRSAVGYDHAKYGFRHKGTQTTWKGRILRRRNG
jgi:hypothetical protein